MKIETKKQLLFLTVFTAIALLCYQINFSQVLGANNQSFTLFQFIGPIGAGIFSPLFGAVSVLAVEALNLSFKAYSGAAIDLFTFVRLLPMVFAAVYFGTNAKNKAAAVVPLVCMGLFLLHPVGQQAWLYPLYWLVPVIGVFWMKENLLMRSLGTTFTAHAVGSVAFLYIYGMTPQFWLALIPVVFAERVLFALGIGVSFFIANTVVHETGLPFLNVDKRYVVRFRNISVVPARAPRSR
jgi:hypothetical protein